MYQKLTRIAWVGDLVVDGGSYAKVYAVIEEYDSRVKADGKVARKRLEGAVAKVEKQQKVEDRLNNFERRLSAGTGGKGKAQKPRRWNHSPPPSRREDGRLQASVLGSLSPHLWRRSSASSAAVRATMRISAPTVWTMARVPLKAAAVVASDAHMEAGYSPIV